MCRPRRPDGGGGRRRPALAGGDTHPAVDDAGVKVTTPSTSDVVVAHGLFLDTLAAGRHKGQAELTAAVRFGTERRVGGGTAWERRGAPVDVAPLTAATLAVWGWLYRPPAPVEPWAMWM
jgi:hypothetical protein